MGGNLTVYDNDDTQLKGATDATLIGNISDRLKVDISASVVPLPTGASTSALQTTGNSSLSSVDTKTPALGQALAAASVPVVLTAAQIITLTPLSTVAATQSGTWNINNISGTISLPTGAATAANQATEITSLQVIDNPIGSVTAGTAGTSSFLIGGVFNITLPTLTNTQQAALQLDSSSRVIIAPLTNVSVVKAQLEDNAGNASAIINAQLQARDVLNTSSQYRAQSVTTTAAEALGAGTILVNRKYISITPTNGTVYWGTNSSVTTTTGTPIFRNQSFIVAVTDNLHIYLIAATTTDTRIVELS